METPAYGPLIGHTTESTVRIWACIKPQSHTPIKANTGRIRYREEPKSAVDSPWSQTHSFRFNATFRYTGLIELQELKPNTVYEYQLGYLEYESEPDTDWSNIPVYRFRTGKKTSNSKRFSMALGSCLYPNRWFTPGWFRDFRADKAFKHLSAWQNSNKPLDMMLFMGDTVYADPQNMLGPSARTPADFDDLYHEVFSGKYFSRAIRQIPCYMMMDDHEVNDSFTDGPDAFIEKLVRPRSMSEDWPEYEYIKRGRTERMEGKLISAITSYYSFGAVHGPIFDNKKIEGDIAYVKGQGKRDIPEKHYYTLDYGRVGMFVMDSRLDRTPDQMISNEQMNDLLEWLTESKAEIKMVATSVTFLADSKDGFLTPGSPDNWERAEDQRLQILNHIVDNGIRNVFFLSGDVHACFACGLKFNDKPYPVYQIVCSPFFWPVGTIGGLMRWKRKNVRFNEKIRGAERFSIGNPISVRNSDDYFTGNGIGRIDVTEKKLRFEVHARDTSPGEEAIVLKVEMSFD